MLNVPRALPPALTCLAAIALFAQPSYAPPNAGDVPNPYKPFVTFGHLPEGRKWGATAGVSIAPDGNIWTYDRCAANTCAGSDLDPIFELDQKTGEVLKHFGKGLFVQPHGLYVDKDGNVWVTDGAAKDGKGNQVYKFSPEGKVLMTIPGFDAPNAVLVLPGGDILVAEGHAPTIGNSRIMKFDKTGKFIKVLVPKGEGPGEVMEPHCLALDSAGRLFVADRSNNRIQILTQDGKFMAEWKQFGRPSGLYIKDDILYVSDSESHPDRPGSHGYNPGCDRGFRMGSVKDGKVTGFIPNPDGMTGGSEGIAVDHEGNVYGASRIAAEAGRLERFER